MAKSEDIKTFTIQNMVKTKPRATAIDKRHTLKEFKIGQRNSFQILLKEYETLMIDFLFTLTIREIIHLFQG